MTKCKILTDVNLTQDGEPYTVHRTWRERLFTRPWRPLTTTRRVIPRVPYRGVLLINSTTIVVHPETLRQLQS